MFKLSKNYAYYNYRQCLTIQQMNDVKYMVTPICSGDCYVTDEITAKAIVDRTGATVVDMESASIAQVCKLDNIPFLVIRSISDKPNGNNHITFDQFLEKASKRCAQIIKEFLI